MKIKRIHLIGEDELKDLVKSIDFCIERISKNDLENSTWTLTRIKENLSKNLEVKDL